MEIDSCQIGSLTVRLSFTTKFILTLEREGREIETTSQDLLGLMAKGAGFMESDGVLELQPTSSGSIIRKIKFEPKYKRTAIRIQEDKITQLKQYLNETMFIQKEMKKCQIAKRNKM